MSATLSGVIMSRGLSVEGVESAKRDVKLSPGAERKDSAGEASNLTRGDDCWNAMLPAVSCCRAQFALTDVLIMTMLLSCSLTA